MAVDKYYPVQGSNKFMTVSYPITKAFTIDIGEDTATGTHTLFTVPKGSVVLGFIGRVTEALATTNAGTVQVGFTGVGGMLSTAHASGAFTVGDIITGNSNSALSSKTYQLPYCLTANDTFDVIVGTDVPSAGKMDVFLTYIPSPVNDLSTSEFLSYSL